MSTEYITLYWILRRLIIAEWLNEMCSHQFFKLNYTPSTEKAMAPYSSTLAWKIPWMEEPGGLQSMGSPRVGYDWATSLSLFTFMHWRRKWQPTPVFFLENPVGEEPGGLQSTGSHSRTRLNRLSTHRTHAYIWVKESGCSMESIFSSGQ